MPFHDLNIAYTADHAAISNTLLFAKELGYETVAVSIAVTGKLPAEPPLIPVSAITKPDGIQLLTRLTLTVSDTTQNHRLSSLKSQYDIVALRPTTERAIQLCCSSLDCDLVSVDFSQRLPCALKFKTVASALQRGVRVEICYSAGIVAGSDATRNLISGATQLIRAARGRGIVLSSEARSALGLRAPWDLINLAQIWGLPQQRAKEALCEESGRVVKLARIKRSTFMGVVDIIDNGTQTSEMAQDKHPQNIKQPNAVDNAGNPELAPSGKQHGVTSQANGTKRKASYSSLNAVQPPEHLDDKAISKSAMKRRAKKARTEGQALSNNDFSNKTASLPPKHKSSKRQN